MTDELDRWTCHWGCGYTHPVADFVERHQDVCEWRPSDAA